jgi:hypothetical protein
VSCALARLQPKQLKPPDAMARGIKLLHKPCLLSAPASLSFSLSRSFILFLYTFEISKWLCRQRVCIRYFDTCKKEASEWESERERERRE